MRPLIHYFSSPNLMFVYNYKCNEVSYINIRRLQKLLGVQPLVINLLLIALMTTITPIWGCWGGGGRAARSPRIPMRGFGTPIG